MTIDQLVKNISNAIVNPLIIVMFAVGFVVFLWGVFEFIKNADSTEGREKGKSHIIWGLVGMVIMMGVFSIIRMSLRTIYG